MNNIIEYKGYIGSVEFSQADALFYGKVQGIRALISYEGTTATELLADFHAAVDDYLVACEAAHIQPEEAYQGFINVQIPPELHRKAAIYTFEHDLSFNNFVEKAIEQNLAIS